MVEIDIVKKAVGPFRVESSFPIPKSVELPTAKPGCAYMAFEPYESTLVTLSSDESKCTPRGIVVQVPTMVTLLGSPLGAVSLKEVISHLARHAVYESGKEDTLLFLSNGALLGVFCDRIDMVAFGLMPASRSDTLFMNDDTIVRELVLSAELVTR